MGKNLCLPMRVKIPMWSWIGQAWGLLICLALLGGSIWLMAEVKHKLWWILAVVLILRILIASVDGLRKTIVSSQVIILEEGIRRATARRVLDYKWEDVKRYQPYRLDFALFFKNGDVICFPAEAKEFHAIRDFVTKRLEDVGQFEDGRVTALVLFSISIKTLLWILLSLAATIAVLAAR